MAKKSADLAHPELADAGRNEVGAHLVVAADFIDQLLHFAGQLVAATIGLHRLPVEIVINEMEQREIIAFGGRLKAIKGGGEMGEVGSTRR